MYKMALFIYALAKGRNYKHTLDALRIADKCHEGQKRKDGADYIEHLLGTCQLVIAQGFYDDATWAAAILHDTIEDTEYTYEDVVKDFNEDIAGLVNRLTKKEGMTIEKYMREVVGDIRAILIKACDRTHNVSDMVKAFSPEKMTEYIIETRDYILPMMKNARRKHHEYADALVALTLHIKAVLLLAEKVVYLEEQLVLKSN